MPQYTEETFHQNKTFEDTDYSGMAFRYQEYSNCTFYRCNLSNSSLQDCTFEDCTFNDCDLSLIKLRSVSFNNIAIQNSKAVGVVWKDASNPFTVNFKDSIISFCSFEGKHLKKIQIINCKADDADFTACNLTEASFTGTDLRGAIFFNTDLSKANFAGALNYTIDPRNNKIAKAKFSMPEAMSFLRDLGIIVVE